MLIQFNLGKSPAKLPMEWGLVIRRALIDEIEKMQTSPIGPCVQLETRPNFVENWAPYTEKRENIFFQYYSFFRVEHKIALTCKFYMLFRIMFPDAWWCRKRTSLFNYIESYESSLNRDSICYKSETAPAIL